MARATREVRHPPVRAGRAAFALAAACAVPLAISTTTGGRAAPASSVSVSPSPSPAAGASGSASLTVLARSCGPDAVLVDATHVYYHEGCGSRPIVRVDRSGSGTPSILAVEIGEPAGIEGDALLVRGARTPISTGGTSAALAWLPKVGGVARPIIAQTRYPIFTVAADASAWVLATDDPLSPTGAGELLLAARPGGAIKELGKGRYRALALDATHVFAMDMDGKLSRFSRDGGARTVLHGSGGFFFWQGSFVLDGDEVYFPASDGVRKVKKSGGASQLLIAAGAVERIQLSGDGTIYFLGELGAAGDKTRGVFRAPKSGGKATPLSAVPENVVAFALDDDHVVVAIKEPGRIARVRR